MSRRLGMLPSPYMNEMNKHLMSISRYVHLENNSEIRILNLCQTDLRAFTGTNRLIGYDYGSPNHYFIAICVKGRTPVFGQISNSIMQLSQLGIHAENEWKRTAIIRPDANIELGEFVIMPDHFHAIVTIGENQFNEQFTPNSMGAQTQNVGSIIRGFKAAVTGYAKRNNIQFEWQSRYYDRIVRDDEEYRRIEKYIRDNVKNWKQQDYK